MTASSFGNRRMGIIGVAGADDDGTDQELAEALVDSAARGPVRLEVGMRPAEQLGRRQKLAKSTGVSQSR